MQHFEIVEWNVNKRSISSKRNQMIYDQIVLPSSRVVIDKPEKSLTNIWRILRSILQIGRMLQCCTHTIFFVYVCFFHFVIVIFPYFLWYVVVFKEEKKKVQNTRSKLLCFRQLQKVQKNEIGVKKLICFGSFNKIDVCFNCEHKCCVPPKKIESILIRKEKTWKKEIEWKCILKMIKEKNALKNENNNPFRKRRRRAYRMEFNLNCTKYKKKIFKMFFFHIPSSEFKFISSEYKF